MECKYGTTSKVPSNCRRAQPKPPMVDQQTTTAGDQRQVQHPSQMLDSRTEENVYVKFKCGYSVQKCGVCSERPWMIGHFSIWTSWSAGPDVGNDARMQRSHNLAPDIYMQCITFHSLSSASVIPVNPTSLKFWCPGLLYWCQPPTEFEITGKLFGLSIYRICVPTYPNHIHVDQKMIETSSSESK